MTFIRHFKNKRVSDIEQERVTTERHTQREMQEIEREIQRLTDRKRETEADKEREPV